MKELEEKLKSLDRQEALYNDYWLGLNNNDETDRIYNIKIKERIDNERVELLKLMQK